MNVQTGGSPSQINRGAAHILFVEGGSGDAFDPTVLSQLLKSNNVQMNVSAIGTCDNVVEAAKAMVWQHSTYYFLADRDGRTSEFVEKSWANFPNKDTYNLLFWRKRELENYFIVPEYLSLSAYLNPQANAAQLILAEANRRLFLEAANLVLLRIRAEVTAPPKAWFTQLFPNRDAALMALQGSPELQVRSEKLPRCSPPTHGKRCWTKSSPN